MARIASNYYTSAIKGVWKKTVPTALGERPEVTIILDEVKRTGLRGGLLQTGDKSCLRRAGVTCHKTRDAWMITCSGDLYDFQGKCLERRLNPFIGRVRSEIAQ